MKGQWNSNINVWFPFMYSQKFSVSKFLHSYICERFIHFLDRSVYFAVAKYVGGSWEYINRSQTHECGNWDCGRAIPFLGILIGIFIAVCDFSNNCRLFQSGVWAVVLMMAYSNPFSQSFPSPSSMYLKSGGMGSMPYHMGLGTLGMGLDPMHGQYGNPSK